MYIFTKVQVGCVKMTSTTMTVSPGSCSCPALNGHRGGNYYRQETEKDYEEKKAISEVKPLSPPSWIPTPNSQGCLSVKTQRAKMPGKLDPARQHPYMRPGRQGGQQIQGAKQEGWHTAIFQWVDDPSICYTRASLPTVLQRH